MVLDGLKPQSVFEYFEKISQIPHGSYNTKAISDYIVSVAKEHNLEYIQDDFNNVIIYKNGSEGASKTPLMLQGHIDMVCEKNFETDAKFDFKKDPLKLAIMDDYIYAKGTTLGGDDGIAVAYMLAILTDDTIVAPPLECVFTADEEVGMDGAKGLDVSALKSKRLINIDHEDEGILLTCCAGGKSVELTIPAEYVEGKGVRYNIVICGLMGGHSGTEIDKYRGNANLIMGRLLHDIEKKINFELINLNGGLQENAIPRECNAEILVDEKDAECLESIVSEFENTVKNEYATVEKNLMIYTEADDTCSAKTLSSETKKRIIFLLMTLPDGVVKVSQASDNLVQTSCNAGIIRLNKDCFEVHISVRSSVESEKQALSDKIQFLIEAIGGSFTEGGNYPAWEFVENSPLRDSVFLAYQKVYDRNPRIEGIHAGLETGIFYNKIPNLDIVVLGPNVYDIHTPKEKMSISSVQRTYGLILQILEDLAAE